jgi:hypothetical protein
VRKVEGFDFDHYRKIHTPSSVLYESRIKADNHIKNTQEVCH